MLQLELEGGSSTSLLYRPISEVLAGNATLNREKPTKNDNSWEATLFGSVIGHVVPMSDSLLFSSIGLSLFLLPMGDIF